jgi:hypothetical protein
MRARGFIKIRLAKRILMFCCRILITALLFVLLVVATSLTAARAQKQPPVPRTVSSEVRAACDAAYAIAAKTPGVSVRRRTGTFRDETLQEPVFGCGLEISGSFARAEATGDAALRLHQGFSAQGWQEMVAYSADGTDGTSFAFRKAGVACLVRGTWDGGAAGDPDIPPLDWYKVAVLCTSPVFPEKRWPEMDPIR